MAMTEPAKDVGGLFAHHVGDVRKLKGRRCGSNNLIVFERPGPRLLMINRGPKWLFFLMLAT